MSKPDSDPPKTLVPELVDTRFFESIEAVVIVLSTRTK